MMQPTKIESNTTKKTLREFIPLTIAFYGSLVFLAVYQNVRLYLDGVLNGVINKSFFLHLLHHVGFTAVTSLFLAFLFNFLEGRRPNLGLKAIRFILFGLLLVEGLLIEYYVRNYEIVGFNVLSLNSSEFQFWSTVLSGLGLLLISGFIFHFLSKILITTYLVISRMYPFTIIVFSLFLATLYAERKPINENKTQYLIGNIANEWLDFNKYDGTEEFPLLKTYEQNDVLGEYFNLKNEKPNVVVLIVEGLGSDFIGERAVYKGFTPFLESIRKESLSWESFLSNTGESFAALPTIVGSLPFGEEGFSNSNINLNKNTLFSILKSNGYVTSFNYGGNSTLNHIDKFLDEERVDYIMDRKAFGSDYTLQEKDAARISLGYPDKELFRQFWDLESYQKKPKFDVFLTQSSKTPFLIPNTKGYSDKVEKIVASSKLERNLVKRIKRNKEIFASLLYADEAISGFFESYKRKPYFDNTIFIITGSHNLTELPAMDEISRYRVPFMMYSPLLKAPQRINIRASHIDIAPTLLSLLDKKYDLKIPLKVSCMGNSLLEETDNENVLQIPLFRSKRNIQDYIYGNYFLSSGRVYGLQKNLELTTSGNAPIEEIKVKFKEFKSINSYTTSQNKIIPPSIALFRGSDRVFTKQEMVWITSVFNGKDFDNAFETARELALNNEWDRALLLCSYILSKIPRHADTEILTGRIYAWQNAYDRAMETLEEATRKYPVYADGYAALLDVYFWADKNERVVMLLQSIERNNVKSAEIDQKIARAFQRLKTQHAEETSLDYFKPAKTEMAGTMVHQQ